MAGARQGDAAQLDRAEHGRRGHVSLDDVDPAHPIDYPVFTTRPDTLFGATFFVMAPEHPDVFRLAEGTEHEQAVHDYVNRRDRIAEDRGDADKPKTGVPLGRTVTNPVNGEQLPMFVADYVLMEYGTGAIMAVPAHDERDFEFATAFDLPIRRVIANPDGRSHAVDELPYTGDGPMVNSGEFDGLHNRKAYQAIVDWLDSEGAATTVSYRLRDWLVSRQRYWGCPIPVVYCERDGLVPVPEEDLPVLLPEVEDYQPKGRSPLAAAELGQHDVPALRRSGPPRDRHDGHVRRLALVLPAVLRRQQRQAAWDRRSSTAGCRSTSTSAASSTRSCT